MSLGALGVVFGDIGTSPALRPQAIFGLEGDRLPVTPANILGATIAINLDHNACGLRKIYWPHYVRRQQGRGRHSGAVALLKSRGRWKGLAVWTLVGIVGVSLFFGDSAITPAISVLSAAEGAWRGAAKAASLYLAADYYASNRAVWLQRYGSGRSGQLFGPIMLRWFVTIAAGGLHQIMQQPGVLKLYRRWWRCNFAGAHPLLSLLALGAIVLALLAQRRCMRTWVILVARLLVRLGLR